MPRARARTHPKGTLRRGVPTTPPTDITVIRTYARDTTRQAHALLVVLDIGPDPSATAQQAQLRRQATPPITEEGDLCHQ